ncbi:DUF6301 family protein [Actinomyces sp. MRS3W]|uniref:DUF6301 family protein n=1 Tax=Actinomyces sp. MRS3W TaxID=2800796 RepID=UPI0028FDC450|nr:DUF6301 family protein [Actinomyces sp. MRS3W]MDU0348117.1 DUF6301 family protein [Actinomyces sp. MRS3W]
MRILPTERAVEWIHAWTELDWPITWETAYATRDKLGWKPEPEDPELFTTELTANQDGGYITRYQNAVGDISIPLTSFNTSETKDHTWINNVWRAYDLYAKRLTNLYGNGKQTGSRMDILQTDWITPKGVTVSLIGSAEGIEADLDSPEITAIDQLESYYIDKYGENYVDD